jgi:hypothetical protein
MDGLIHELLASDPQGPALQQVVRAFSFSPLHVLLLTAIPGGAMLAAALLPQRTTDGLRVVGSRPAACWLLGVAVLAVLCALLALLLAHGIRPGRWLLASALLFGSAGGIAVSARLIGQRLAPQSDILVHLLLGLLCVGLLLCSPACLPVLALLAPLGLGGLILAGQTRSPPR